MLKPRLIPCLLIKDKGLVKTIRFKSPKYIGDPLNTVRIFNEKEVDEITIFDIDASSKNIKPDFQLIEKLAQECRMPLCYGGGIKNIQDIKKLISLGVEKVSISSEIINNPELIIKAAETVGSQSIVATLDIRIGGLFKLGTIFTNNGRTSHSLKLIPFLKKIENYGIGEIIINDINKDGLMNGYDIKHIKKISQVVKVPITFLGGAGNLNDIKLLWETDPSIGAAAGSLFVFKGKYKAVLVNYPSAEEKRKLYF